MTGDIPVGTYDPSNLANLGIGHGAADGGFGYTYFNPETGHEFSAVTGVTYNLKNTQTGYQNGIDWHLDWGISKILSKQFFVGAVGYAYQQLTPDKGQSPLLGEFKSRVLGVGPQVGYLFPFAGTQGYLNLKRYYEFDAQNRPSGWNAWVTFAISPAEKPAPRPVGQTHDSQARRLDNKHKGSWSPRVKRSRLSGVCTASRGESHEKQNSSISSPPHPQ